jgi:quercetin dioxygenase-like cupin family protein
MKKIHYTDVAPKAFKSPAQGVSGRVVIGKADGAENYCMRVIELAPGGLVPPHSHPWEHEQFYHSGTGQVLSGEDWIDVGPGDVAFVPADARHGIRNTGSEPMVIVCSVPPFAPEL